MVTAAKMEEIKRNQQNGVTPADMRNQDGSKGAPTVQISNCGRVKLMNEFLEGLITGIYIGACIGAVAMALMAAGSDDDDINGRG